jgi:hypothetical protein
MHFALKLAERKSERERSSSGTLGGGGEDAQPSAAELAMRSLDTGLIEGPLIVEPDEERDEQPRETDRPSTCTQFPGAF